MSLLSFLSSKKTIYALDIGSRFIKVAEFDVSEDQIVLTNFQMETCPPQALDRGNVVDYQILSQSLSSVFFKKIKVTGKYELIQAIGGSSVITGTLNIPKTGNSTIRNETIRLEVSQYLPVDLKEVYYLVIDLPDFGEQDNVESVFVIAIKKESLSNFNLAIRTASLNTSVDYPSMLALSNCFVLNHKNEINRDQYVILLDIGFQKLDFCVMRGESLVFSREFPVGVENYVLEIQNELGVSYKESQSLLDTTYKNDSVPESVMHIVQNYNSLCCKEISMGMDYFFNYFPQAVCSSAYLTGGGKSIPQLKSQISKKLNLPTHDLQTLRSVKTKGFTKQRIKELQPLLATCVGLVQTKIKKK